MVYNSKQTDTKLINSMANIHRFYIPQSEKRGLTVFYKPNYCCNCAEKIERVQWSFTTSRRFCDVCQTEFLWQDWQPTVLSGLMILLGLFGVGSLLASGNKASPEAVKQISGGNSNRVKTLVNRQNVSNSNINLPTNTTQTASNNQTNAPKTVLTNKTPAVKTEITQNRAEEPVYFCGALTKKGTPCSRRVKGGGRCWQHKGQATPLPESKLLVKP